LQDGELGENNAALDGEMRTACMGRVGKRGRVTAADRLQQAAGVTGGLLARSFGLLGSFARLEMGEKASTG